MEKGNLKIYKEIFFNHMFNIHYLAQNIATLTVIVKIY